MKKNNLILAVSAAILLSTSQLTTAEEYPAADFQPKVLFADDSANDSAVKNQPKATAASSTSSATATKSVSVSKTSSTAAPQVSSTAKSEDSSMTMILALLALAGGGFFFMKKQGECKSSTGGSYSSQSYGKDPSGLSGVARYLKSREMLSASGVARYLAKQEEAAKANAQAQAASDAKATGVEKYLKNRG